MTYHSVCKNSSDYIKALKEAREIAKNISADVNATKGQEIFPYRYSLIQFFTPNPSPAEPGYTLTLQTV